MGWLDEYTDSSAFTNRDGMSCILAGAGLGWDIGCLGLFLKEALSGGEFLHHSRNVPGGRKAKLSGPRGHTTSFPPNSSGQGK